MEKVGRARAREVVGFIKLRACMHAQVKNRLISWQAVEFKLQT